MKQPTDL